MANIEMPMDPDVFAEMVQAVLDKSEINMVIHKDAESKEYCVKGSGVLKNAVMMFYVYLNGFEPIFTSMLEQLGDALIPGCEEELLDGILEELKSCVMQELRDDKEYANRSKEAKEE